MKSKSEHSNKIIEPHFPMVLFTALHKKVLTFHSVKNYSSVTIQRKSVDQYFPGV